MSSGVKANEDCLQAFRDLKLRKKNKYIIFGLNKENTEIVVLHRSPESATPVSNEDAYEEFLSHFSKEECKYAVFDFEFEKEEGAGKRSKLCFISWAPDGSRIKQKMVYASSKDALRRTLDTFPVEIQGTDFDEVSYETVLEKANRGH